MSNTSHSAEALKILVGVQSQEPPHATLARALQDRNGTLVLYVNADGNLVAGAGVATDLLITPTVATSITPATNDGAPLGSASKQWSDLFLASGGVLNYANGNVVVTHTSGVLTIGTGDLRVTNEGSNTASVVTAGGTQTLTNKTLTDPVVNTAAVARTATATGATTGTIADNGWHQHITVTSASADNIIILPTPTPGVCVTLFIGSNGCELRTSSPATVNINAGSGANAESALAAGLTVFMTCISSVAWRGFSMAADGTLAAVEAAAP